MSEEKVMAGAFAESLKRNNQKIRDDRAASICEDAEMMFRRNIEDLKVDIKRMQRERENMLDMSPDDTTSLILASDFDAKDFVRKELTIGVNLRNAEIKLEIAEARYKYLFEGE